MYKALPIIVTIVLCLFIINHTSSAQTALPREIRRIKAQPDEVISMSKTMNFNQAVKSIGELSKKYHHKMIVSQVDSNDPIGIDIDNMHWLDALETILFNKGLWYTEYADYILIHEIAREETQAALVDSAAILFNTREVMISAVFFEANDTKLRQMGFSWNIFKAGGDTVLMTAAEERASLIEVKVTEDLDFGQVISTFRALESKQVGDIIASPQVSVMSGEVGQVQIGSDYSITTQDFAGNAITSFFSTGTILKVTPVIIKYDTLHFIFMELEVEKSSAAAYQTGSTEVKKTMANTSILLLDGEETIIGGLYTTEESMTREGVPLLKDLPWWFFGLRYLFGYESKNFIRKELIILLQANLLPPLEQRILRKAKQFENKDDFKEYFDKHKEKFEK